MFSQNVLVFKVIVVSFFMVGATVQGEDGCKKLDYLECVKNKTFTDHVIKSVRVLAPGLESCQHNCFLEDKCVSYNLGPMEGEMRWCELNAADHVTRPGHVVPKNGFDYCPIKHRCSSNPCPAGRMCTPDFSWDTFRCDDGGWTEWSTWTTCQSSPTTCPRRRSRTCTNPPPQNNGAKCSGSAVETKKCVNAVQKGCEIPLGMEDRSITDSQITASSTFQSLITLNPWEARLNNPGITSVTYGSWAAASPSSGEYLQVDLGCPKIITKIATQGRSIGSNQWVTQYTVSYSNDTINWINHQPHATQFFPGNIDKHTVKFNQLNPPIMARYIRIIVRAWRSWPTMRMELYGCSLL